MILKLIHWIGVFLVWFSALLVPKKCLPWAVALQVGTMLSWIMFHRCIMWDLEKKMDPAFNVQSDTITCKTRFNPETVKKSTDFLIYTTLFILLYVIINKKFAHRGNDDMSKY